MRRLCAILLVSLVCGGLPSLAAADDADDQFALATGHYVRGNYEFAAEELQYFLEKFSADGRAAEARFYLGESQSQLQQFAEAAAAYQQYLADRPQGQHALVATFRVAECLYFVGDPAAEAALRDFVTAWPDDDLNNFARPYLANCVSKHDNAAAIKEFRDALSKQPGSPLADECRVGLARCLETAGESTESQRIFEALIAKRGSAVAPKALYFLARSHFARENFAQAEKAFGELLAGYPVGEWVPFAKLGRARTLFEQNKNADAVTALQLLIVDPQVGVDARYWLGMAHKQAARYDAAVTLLLPLATQSPAHELADDALFHAADTLRVVKKSQRARDVYQQLLAKFPTSSWKNEALLGLARLALARDDHQELEQSLAPLYDIADQAQRVEVRRLLARSYLADEKPEAAIAELEALTSLRESDSRRGYTQYLLATAYAKANRPQDALHALANVEASTDDSSSDDDTGDLAFNLAAERAFAQATANLALQQHEPAAAALRIYLQAASSNDERKKIAAGELAVCLIQIRKPQLGQPRDGEIAAALNNWRSYPNNSAEHQQLALRIAEALYASQAYDWAAEVFAQNVQDAQRQTLSDATLLAKFRSGLAWSLYHAGRIDEAIAALQQVVTLHADSKLAAEAAMLLAGIYQDKQLYDEAATAYQHVVDAHPQSVLRPQAMLSLATCLANSQQAADAIDLYDQFLCEYPDHEKRHIALYQAAWLAKDCGKPDDALRHFQMLYEQCRSSQYWPDAAYRIAEGHFATGEYDIAIRILNNLLQDEQRRMRPFSLYLQGRIAWEQERYSDVTRWMDQLSSEFPTHELRLAASYFAADALTLRNEFVAAAERWASLAELAMITPGSPADAWPAKIALRRVQTLNALQRWSDAAEVAQAALNASPDFEFNYEFHFAVGRSLAAAGRLTDARDAYAAVLASPAGAKTETAAKAQLMIAETYFHQENYDQAVREYLKVEILYAYRPWQAAGLFQAGVCYEKLGKPERANEHYRRLVRDFADTEYSQRAAQRLR